MSRVCATRQSSSYVSGAHRKRIAQVQVVNVGQSARKRLERYRQLSSIADPFSLAEVVRDLHGRSHDHRLTEAESNLAENAVGLLAEEIAHIENREPRRVRTSIDRVLKS